MKTTRKLTLLTCLVLLQVEFAFGWVFPEHRDIAVLAWQRLSPDQQASLQKLWSEARAGHESRLCEKPADAAQGPKPDCIDYAAWSAISGDHSCSAQDMLVHHPVFQHFSTVLRVSTGDTRFRVLQQHWYF